MVNLTPPYKGWAAKLAAEKHARSVIKRFTNEQLDRSADTFEALQNYAEGHGFVLTKTPTGAELRLKR